MLINLKALVTELRSAHRTWFIHFCFTKYSLTITFLSKLFLLLHAHALEMLKTHLVEGVRVLDVGSGSGYLVACFAQMVNIFFLLTIALIFK